MRFVPPAALGAGAEAVMGGLCEAMGSICAVLKEWHAVGIYHLLKEWQTLIAGVIAFVAALMTIWAIKR